MSDDFKYYAPTSNERREVASALRDVDIAYSTTSVLADLIDPTCHLWPLYDGGFGCDRCFTGFLDMKAKTSYCPACGARVVSGGE